MFHVAKHSSPYPFLLATRLLGWLNFVYECHKLVDVLAPLGKPVSDTCRVLIKTVAEKLDQDFQCVIFVHCHLLPFLACSCHFTHALTIENATNWLHSILAPRRFPLPVAFSECLLRISILSHHREPCLIATPLQISRPLAALTITPGLEGVGGLRDGGHGVVAFAIAAITACHSGAKSRGWSWKSVGATPCSAASISGAALSSEVILVAASLI